MKTTHRKTIHAFIAEQDDWHTTAIEALIVFTAFRGIFNVIFLKRNFLFLKITSHPLDFLARLAALVPKPRVNLTGFHGVFTPNCKQRALVTPAKRGKGNKAKAVDEPQISIKGSYDPGSSPGQALGTANNARVQYAPGHPLLMLRINSPCRHQDCSEYGGTVKVIPKALAALGGQTFAIRCFQRVTHLALRGECQAFSETAGRVMVAHGFLPPATLVHPCTS